MTTIMVDFREKKLYTDSRCTSSSKIGAWPFKKESKTFLDNTVKIWPSSFFGRAYTGTGDLKVIESAIALIEQGKTPKIKDNTFVWQIDSYPSFVVSSHSSGGLDKVDSCDFLCNGSGKQFVSAAYHACGDAFKSMEIAIDLDEYSGGEIKVYDVSGATQWGDLE